jgi:hypothetical protein
MLEFKKETLTFSETENNYQKPFYILLCVCFILVLSLSYSFYILSIQNKELKQIQINKCEIENLKTLKQVDSFIDILPFSDKNLIKRQYRIESYYLKSNLVRTNNNLFGIKNAEKRPQTGFKSKINDYREYQSIQLCIIDRLLYEVKNGTSLAGYAEDSQYFKKLSKIKI